MNPMWLILLAGLLAIAYGIVTVNQVMAADPGSQRMQEIAGAIADRVGPRRAAHTRIMLKP